MRTLTAKVSAAAIALSGFAAVGMLLGVAGRANAQVVASDEVAGYLVFPKIIVQASAAPGDLAIDTLIQITNTRTSGDPVTVHCWYVNANGHCDGTGAVCADNSQCQTGICVPGWRPNNFEFTLTNEHPIGWSALQGRDLSALVPADRGTLAEGSIPGVLERPFRGELKCVEVDGPDGPPSAANNLKGEATIIGVQEVAAAPGRQWAASYNAIGFQADVNATNSDALGDPLCLGGLPAGAPAGTECAMEYAPCPNVLILNHFFEQATAPFGSGATVQTALTLVPCSEDLGHPFPDFRQEAPPTVTTQMLVYNEFEQRFSTSTKVQCFRDTVLSDIDTQAGPADDPYSVFAVGVQGTLTGQTRIRGVSGSIAPTGYGLLGVAQEFYSSSPGSPILASDAFNIHMDTGFRAESDAVYGVNSFVQQN
jgi:hypothetical protein